ncbi:hypothetical protein COCON_G00144250 [Conger conger]|uniref:Src-like-adapter 2 n=1 Tax=Conger conger TaxID=82655 RepID=A0A9Q1HW12_CONCO|nr:src-like-adapter 2 [Conger conger]KAJ8265326.1 hypothetical protein COCON_G00144250 [Conger conger]
MGSRSSKDRRSSTTHTSLLSQEESTEAPAVDDNRHVVVSLYNYPSGDLTDCIIRAGEKLNILSEDGDWWRVSSSATGKESYIPSSYTAKVFHRWQYKGISREKAEELLLLPYNLAGSFMIRESQTCSGAHTLSIKRSTSSARGCVKHYRIHQLQNGWHYISPRLTFVSLSQLVDHYSEVADGLCCLLREPCFIFESNNMPMVTGPPMVVRKATLNWKDVDSSMIFSKDKVDTEESLVSEGLREAINSYLFMTDEGNSEDCDLSWNT